MKAPLLAVTAFSLLSASAFAAELPLPYKAPPAPAPFTWTGCYAGVNGGGGWGQKDFTDSAGFLAGNGPGAGSVDIDGYMLGGQVGCDYQFASGWVLGVEGYAAGGKIGGNALVPFPGDDATFTEETNFLTSGTARIGYAFGPWLPYIKGGVAWAFDDNYTLADALGNYSAAGTEDRMGWTVGAGIEWLFARDWSLKLEYDYYGFGTRAVTFADANGLINGGNNFPLDIKQNIQLVKLGVNFHFWAGETP